MKKNHYRRYIRLLTLLFIGFAASVHAQNTYRLQYNQPASNWNEALPIGNGRLGAMVFGQPDQEQIQLNEETIWAGEPGNNVPKDAYDKIQEIRKLLFAGKSKEAQELSNATFPRPAPSGIDYGMPYQPFGDLWIKFPDHKQYTSYSRELDIQDAITRTSYKVGAVTFTREVFAALKDDVVIVKLSADAKNSLSFSIGLSSPHQNSKTEIENNQLALSGVSGSHEGKTGRIQFKGIVRPVLKGGKLIQKDNQLEITNADEVILYISIGTNFKKYNDISGNAAAKALDILNKAAARKYEKAKADHIQKYQQYFNRVSLYLGESPQSKKMTDIRIREFAGTDDPELVALYFQFGRYLLISSSQPGGQPANLQGIWNDKLSPPWDSKYTVNINTEMNYWPAEVTNLGELHEPLFTMLKDLSVTGRESAKKLYHARGWNIHHNTDLWRITGVVDGGFYGMWPMGGAWMSQHLWQHFLYSGDKSFLKEYYPVLKGKALFYLDVLQEEPTHKWLVVAPSMSPENSYQPGVGISAGTTMDNQLVADVFHHFIQAAAVLKEDVALRDSVQLALDRLPPMQIGQHNQLQEWLQDLDKPTDKHRHISHLYGLFPSGQISPFRNPELLEAAKNSMIYRGDKSTGWSMGWKVNWWARLLDGDQAYKLIKDQLSPAPMEDSGQSGGTYPNLLDAHPPFQIDGNFGCTSGIAEMLLQSYDGNIYLLPALPRALANGKVTGLKARGGFEVDMEWKDSKIQKLVVKSTLGGNCRLRLNSDTHLSGNAKLIPAKGENTNSYYFVNEIKSPLKSEKATLKGIQVPSTTLLDFDTKANGIYTFVTE
ncbi:glycosyl hydrolase family 95 catalytic domain-containing protein [Sphingobacterium spiritivorum]|uniref:glycoside hydrolase family 95 protein n=1 Tax=Sphingobacterium spiritivorum TaxID=258 RepID=UPI00191AC55C|nr:glycoside hydrolase family 95 protein [Sphingobacterium spiritivorum]QQT28166.1 glycoside hydrolase family 95 protein [Sphingobacterium spiritivorum]